MEYVKRESIGIVKRGKKIEWTQIWFHFPYAKKNSDIEKPKFQIHNKDS